MVLCGFYNYIESARRLRKCKELGSVIMARLMGSPGLPGQTQVLCHKEASRTRAVGPHLEQAVSLCAPNSSSLYQEIPLPSPHRLTLEGKSMEGVKKKRKKNRFLFFFNPVTPKWPSATVWGCYQQET